MGSALIWRSYDVLWESAFLADHMATYRKAIGVKGKPEEWQRLNAVELDTLVFSE